MCEGLSDILTPFAVFFVEEFGGDDHIGCALDACLPELLVEKFPRGLYSEACIICAGIAWDGLVNAGVLVVAGSHIEHRKDMMKSLAKGLSRRAVERGSPTLFQA